MFPTGTRRARENRGRRAFQDSWARAISWIISWVGNSFTNTRGGTVAMLCINAPATFHRRPVATMSLQLDWTGAACVGYCRFDLAEMMQQGLELTADRARDELCRPERHDRHRHRQSQIES